MILFLLQFFLVFYLTFGNTFFHVAQIIIIIKICSECPLIRFDQNICDVIFFSNKNNIKVLGNRLIRHICNVICHMFGLDNTEVPKL